MIVTSSKNCGPLSDAVAGAVIQEVTFIEVEGETDSVHILLRDGRLIRVLASEWIAGVILDQQKKSQKT